MQTPKKKKQLEFQIKCQSITCIIAHSCFSKT